MQLDHFCAVNGNRPVIQSAAAAKGQVETVDHGIAAEGATIYNMTT
jgi:dsDNA-specific endonuclease/ATPase MutS2